MGCGFFYSKFKIQNYLAKSEILTHLRGLALWATAPAREGAHPMKEFLAKV